MNEDYGIYLHIPFCLSKCPYCSFFSIPTDPQIQKIYFQNLLKQIEKFSQDKWCVNRQVATIFFGGGTPTTMNIDNLVFLLKSIKKSFPIITDFLETSIEVNPATVNEKDLYKLRTAGFNRISIGIQSLSDKQLQLLGRPHTALDAHSTVSWARAAGFDNISIDLMYGLPEQNPSSWRNCLNQAIDLNTEHLSLYELTLEKDTPFHSMSHLGQLILPSEEHVLKMMGITSETISTTDFHRYEISNYCKPNKESRHNINYWHNKSYLGLGAGAVSCFSGNRCRSIEDVSLFCQAIQNNSNHLVETETLNSDSSFRETVIIGLRMIEGVSLSELQKRYHINPKKYYGVILQNLIKQDLVILQDDFLRLTSKGLCIANSVMAELV